MSTEVDDPYSGRRIRGNGIEAFRPFGPVFEGVESSVHYQKPGGFDIDVRFDHGWLVLSLGHSRSTTAIGSDRQVRAESLCASITYMPPDCDIHVQEDVECTSDIVLIVPPPRLFEEANEEHKLTRDQMHYFWSSAPETGKIGRSLRQMMLNRELGHVDPLMIENAAALSVDHLFDLYTHAIGKQRNRNMFGLTGFQLGKIKTFVNENLNRVITLENLAAQTNLSHYHFARQFRAATGITPYGYVLSKRMKRAMALLSATNRSQLEIALACGFFDAAHLSNTFLGRIGVRPMKYRQITQS